MKKPNKITILIIFFFVGLPLVYLLRQILFSPSVNANNVMPKNSLKCALVEQYTDGNTLIATLKNEGNFNWSEEAQIRCTIFMNGQDTGIRVTLEPGQIVEPGETAEFHFYDVLSTFDETAEIVMLQETVAYFEERFPVDVMPQEPMVPQTDLHCELVEQHMDGDTLIVTMKNTGGSEWKEKDWIRCTIFIDGKDSDVRAELQPGQIVAVGESAEFRFPDLSDRLDESAEIVMLQETVAYFEERFLVIFP